jgi:hypothetical protein
MEYAPDNFCRWPVRHVKPFAGLLVCLLLGGCSRSTAPYSPGPDFADYRLREDCLYQTLCPEIRKRGPKDVEGAAAYASSVCEQSVSQKRMQHASSIGGSPALKDEASDERMAQLEFDWHAMAVAQRLKDQCGGASE